MVLTWTARIVVVGLAGFSPMGVLHHSILLLENSGSADRIAIEYHAYTYEPVKNYYAEELNNDVFVYHVKPGTDLRYVAGTTKAYPVPIAAVTRAAAHLSASGTFTSESYDVSGMRSWKVTNCQRFIVTLCRAVPELADLLADYNEGFKTYTGDFGDLEQIKYYLPKRWLDLIKRIAATRPKILAEAEIDALEREGESLAEQGHGTYQTMEILYNRHSGRFNMPGSA